MARAHANPPPWRMGTRMRMGIGAPAGDAGDTDRQTEGQARRPTVTDGERPRVPTDDRHRR